jgi:hypothetical protein
VGLPAVGLKTEPHLHRHGPLFLNTITSFHPAASLLKTSAIDPHAFLYQLTSANLNQTTSIFIMGARDVLSRKAGVIVGDDVLNLFNYAQKEGCEYQKNLIEWRSNANHHSRHSCHQCHIQQHW